MRSVEIGDLLERTPYDFVQVALASSVCAKVLNLLLAFEDHSTKLDIEHVPINIYDNAVCQL